MQLSIRKIVTDKELTSIERGKEAPRPLLMCGDRYKDLEELKSTVG